MHQQDYRKAISSSATLGLLFMAFLILAPEYAIAGRAAAFKKLFSKPKVKFRSTAAKTVKAQKKVTKLQTPPSPKKIAKISLKKADKKIAKLNKGIEKAQKKQLENLSTAHERTQNLRTRDQSKKYYDRNTKQKLLSEKKVAHYEKKAKLKEEKIKAQQLKIEHRENQIARDRASKYTAARSKPAPPIDRGGGLRRGGSHRGSDATSTGSGSLSRSGSGRSSTRSLGADSGLSGGITRNGGVRSVSMYGPDRGASVRSSSRGSGSLRASRPVEHPDTTVTLPRSGGAGLRPIEPHFEPPAPRGPARRGSLPPSYRAPAPQAEIEAARAKLAQEQARRLELDQLNAKALSHRGGQNGFHADLEAAKLTKLKAAHPTPAGITEAEHHAKLALQAKQEAAAEMRALEAHQAQIQVGNHTPVGGRNPASLGAHEDPIYGNLPFGNLPARGTSTSSSTSTASGTQAAARRAADREAAEVARKTELDIAQKREIKVQNERLLARQKKEEVVLLERQARQQQIEEARAKLAHADSKPKAPIPASEPKSFGFRTLFGRGGAERASTTPEGGLRRFRGGGGNLGASVKSNGSSVSGVSSITPSEFEALMHPAGGGLARSVSQIRGPAAPIRDRLPLAPLRNAPPPPVTATLPKQPLPPPPGPPLPRTGTPGEPVAHSNPFGTPAVPAPAGPPVQPVGTNPFRSESIARAPVVPSPANAPVRAPNPPNPSNPFANGAGHTPPAGDAGAASGGLARSASVRSDTLSRQNSTASGREPLQGNYMDLGRPQSRLTDGHVDLYGGGGPPPVPTTPRPNRLTGEQPASASTAQSAAHTEGGTAGAGSGGGLSRSGSQNSEHTTIYEEPNFGLPPSSARLERTQSLRRSTPTEKSPLARRGSVPTGGRPKSNQGEQPPTTSASNAHGSSTHGTPPKEGDQYISVKADPELEALAAQRRAEALALKEDHLPAKFFGQRGSLDSLPHAPTTTTSVAGTPAGGISRNSSVRASTSRGTNHTEEPPSNGSFLPGGGFLPHEAQVTNGFSRTPSISRQPAAAVKDPDGGYMTTNGFSTRQGSQKELSHYSEASHPNGMGGHYDEITIPPPRQGNRTPSHYQEPHSPLYEELHFPSGNLSQAHKTPSTISAHAPSPGATAKKSGFFSNPFKSRKKGSANLETPPPKPLARSGSASSVGESSLARQGSAHSQGGSPSATTQGSNFRERQDLSHYDAQGGGKVGGGHYDAVPSSHGIGKGEDGTYMDPHPHKPPSLYQELDGPPLGRGGSAGKKEGNYDAPHYPASESIYSTIGRGQTVKHPEADQYMSLGKTGKNAEATGPKSGSPHDDYVTLGPQRRSIEERKIEERWLKHKEDPTPKTRRNYNNAVDGRQTQRNEAKDLVAHRSGNTVQRSDYSEKNHLLSAEVQRKKAAEIEAKMSSASGKELKQLARDLKKTNARVASRERKAQNAKETKSTAYIDAASVEKMKQKELEQAQRKEQQTQRKEQRKSDEKGGYVSLSGEERRRINAQSRQAPGAAPGASKNPFASSAATSGGGAHLQPGSPTAGHAAPTASGASGQATKTANPFATTAPAAVAKPGATSAPPLAHEASTTTSGGAHSQSGSQAAAHSAPTASGASGHAAPAPVRGNTSGSTSEPRSPTAAAAAAAVAAATTTAEQSAAWAAAEARKAALLNRLQGRGRQTGPQELRAAE